MKKSTERGKVNKVKPTKSKLIWTSGMQYYHPPELHLPSQFCAGTQIHLCLSDEWLGWPPAVQLDPETVTRPISRPRSALLILSILMWTSQKKYQAGQENYTVQRQWRAQHKKRRLKKQLLTNKTLEYQTQITMKLSRPREET